MKQLSHLFYLLPQLLLVSFCSAQTMELPKISSQYLTQGNDYGAALVIVDYDYKKASLILGGKPFEFSQKNLYDYLDERYKKLNQEISKQANIKIEAPKYMPVSYLQDIYAWIQIYGNQYLHLAMYESMSPDKKQYLPLDVLPFNRLEEACGYYAKKSGKSNTAIGTFTEVHPNSQLLTTDNSKDIQLSKKDIRPKHYIPQKMLHIDLKEKNEVIFKKQQVNTMVLGSMIQNELMENYNSSYNKTSPEKHLWLNLRMEKKVPYQQYAEVLLALQEAFHLYWEELAYNKYQKAYLELDVQQQWNIRQAAPKLISQYDQIELQFIQDKLSEGSPQLWFDVK